MITDTRGIGVTYYETLEQTEATDDLERHSVAACLTMDIMVTDRCANDQTTVPPVSGDHIEYGNTDVVNFSNSVCGAQSSSEGGKANNLQQYWEDSKT